MDLGDFLWSLLVIYFIFFYFMILFRVIGDLFSDQEASGMAKTGWLIFLLFLPFLALFIYLVTKGKAMNERAIARAEQMNAAQQDYIRQVAGTADVPAAEIAKAHDLLTAGAISPAEFDTLKAKALA
jgi:phosphoglycerol transferase MdoB-like AlkP superfamily enzyme